MPPIRCVIARTTREVADAQRIRWQVYGEEEQLLPPSVSVDGREIDARDLQSETLHFVVYADEEAVGTVRLLLPSTDPEATRDGRLGLDLDSKLHLAALAAPGFAPAEVTRYCVPRCYRFWTETWTRADGKYAWSGLTERSKVYPETADVYAGAVSRRTAIGVVGDIGGAVVGAPLGWNLAASSSERMSSDAQIGPYGVGGGFIALSFLMLAVWHDPAADFADVYNASLRRQLGIPETAAGPVPDAAIRPPQPATVDYAWRF